MNYLHISFNGDLEGVWEPKMPVGSYAKKREKVGAKFSEPLRKRICVSPTLWQCFLAVYPNVYKFFEVENLPWMEFFVYGAKQVDKSKVMTPYELAHNRWVHDALVTGEHWLLEPTKMLLIEKIKIFNTNKSPSIFYHPFGDRKEKEISLGPRDIKLEIVATFKGRPAVERLVYRPPLTW